MTVPTIAVMEIDSTQSSWCTASLFLPHEVSRPWSSVCTAVSHIFQLYFAFPNGTLTVINVHVGHPTRTMLERWIGGVKYLQNSADTISTHTTP